MALLPDGAIRRSHELTGGAFKLYAYICKLRNHKTGICWPRGRTAAAYLEVDPARIVGWRRELVAKGWIIDDRPTKTMTPLVGFPGPIAESATKVAESAISKVAENAIKVAESATSNCGKRKMHIIRNEPAHEPAHEPAQRATRARAREGLSRFSIEECRKYAATLPHARSPSALARLMHRTGEDDELIAAFLELPEAQACVAKAVPKPGCRFCDGLGWQPIHDGTRGRVVECECNGESAYQEPAWSRRFDGRWERAKSKAVAEQ